MDYCLHNLPEKIYGGAVCGNGFTELGEDCDCGLPQVSYACHVSNQPLIDLSECVTLIYTETLLTLFALKKIDKREDYQKSCVLCCILCTMI